MNIKPILDNPSLSYWVKNAITSLNERDPLDAFHDAKILLQFASEKLQIVCPEMFQEETSPQPQPKNIIQFPTK
jgi:hypothetical protein